MEDNEHEHDGIEGMFCCPRYPVQMIVVSVIAQTLWKLDKDGFVSFDGLIDSASEAGVCPNSVASEHLRMFRDMGIITVDEVTDTLYKGKNFDVVMEGLRPKLHFSEDDFKEKSLDG
jgi:hypothetical protein